LFFIIFLKIECNKGPNFVAQFEQVVRNYPNSTLKASLEISPAGADWTTSLLAPKETPDPSKMKDWSKKELNLQGIRRE
jgi:hypothetical protein